jgi:hypothetical protein
MSYFDHIQVASSRLLNAVVHGDGFEMFSSRTYRDRFRNPMLYRVVNLMFFWQEDHCKQSWEWEDSLKCGYLR